MTKREIALALIRREAQEHGELTLIALRAAQEHRIGYAAMMEAARDGLRRRAKQLPIVTIDGRRYYRDERLGEYRAVDNPHDRRPL